jgi:hypothetical protein
VLFVGTPKVVALGALRFCFRACREHISIIDVEAGAQNKKCQESIELSTTPEKKGVAIGQKISRTSLFMLVI